MRSRCQKMCRQEEARMLTIRRHALSEREERKRYNLIEGVTARLSNATFGTLKFFRLIAE